MKTKFFLSAMLASLIATSFSFAQNKSPYPPFDKDSYIEKVKIQGQKPTIKDFVNTFLKDSEDEFTGMLSEMWTRYLTGKPQTDGHKLTVDVRNGYVKFVETTEDYEGDITVSTTEMCYWNCSDQKHKIFAVSNSLFSDGKFVDGQYTGVTFFLYENSTKRMMVIYRGDIGAEPKSENEHIVNGFDGKDYYYEINGKKTILTKEEYFDWYENYFPVIIYHLPQQGKDLTIELWTPKKVIMKVFTWDGLKFHAPKGQ